MKSKLTKDQVFEKLQEMDRLHSLRPDDITLNMVRERFQWGRSKAKRYLDEMVKNKELVEVPISNGGRAKSAWRVP